MVAIAVFLFISSGTIREGYEHLLQIGDYDRQKKKENKVIGAVSAIVWPIAVVIFLVSGFVYDKWDICWIVFPITGILFGMFSAAYSIITNKQE
jgi:fatty acid desaturase